MSVLQIAGFWTWFSKGPGRWPPPPDELDEDRLLALFDRLAKDFPALTPEFSWTPGERYELVFSLVGNRDHAARRAALPVVRALVKAAPRSPRWSFRAFAGPIGWMDAYLPQLDFPPGSRLAVAKLKYVVLRPRPLALRVFVPRYTHKHHGHFLIAAERVLEAGLGEAWVLERLHRLELADLRQAPARARPVTALSASPLTRGRGREKARA